jgi:Tfp pilus assembly protein FimT
VRARTMILCTADSDAQHRRRIGISSVGRVRVCRPPAAGEPACPIACP